MGLPPSALPSRSTMASPHGPPTLCCGGRSARHPCQPPSTAGLLSGSSQPSRARGAGRTALSCGLAARLLLGLSRLPRRCAASTGGSCTGPRGERRGERGEC